MGSSKNLNYTKDADVNEEEKREEKANEDHQDVTLRQRVQPHFDRPLFRMETFWLMLKYKKN